MEYAVENEFLKVTVTTWGAQVKSVIRKCDGVEHMWQADPAVWGYHAPILFPYCGKLKDGVFEIDGKTYSMGGHGFARKMEHRFVSKSDSQIVMELDDSSETRKMWPFRFRLITTVTLERDTVRHKLTVVNTDEKKMPFGIGFHPAFAVPFDREHDPSSDYELRFDRLESPLCLQTPDGLPNGKTYCLGKNIRAIPVNDRLFQEGSHCMVSLQSKTCGLFEKDSGRAVICTLEGFPYCLLWGEAGAPRFICIEPWNSLPSPADGGIQWKEKPAAAVLEPGEQWETTLSTAFVR